MDPRQQTLGNNTVQVCWDVNARDNCFIEYNLQRSIVLRVNVLRTIGVNVIQLNSAVTITVLDNDRKSLIWIKLILKN